MNDGPPFSSFSDNANDNAVLGIGCYIILKRHKLSQWQFFRLGTIYLYIILKLHTHSFIPASIWIPYIFTSFSNNLSLLKTPAAVWIPYIFTSFSNDIRGRNEPFSVWIPYIFTSFSNTCAEVKGHTLVWIPYIFTSFSNALSHRHVLL